MTLLYLNCEQLWKSRTFKDEIDIKLMFNKTNQKSSPVIWGALSTNKTTTTTENDKRYHSAIILRMDIHVYEIAIAGLLIYLPH